MLPEFLRYFPVLPELTPDRCSVVKKRGKRNGTTYLCPQCHEMRNFRNNESDNGVHFDKQRIGNL